jgi:GNAT superfamily N-acetyltransferase
MTPAPVIALAGSDADIARCFPVMQQLRPHLVAAEFVPRIRRQQAENFQLAFAADSNGLVRSVAGFRVMEMLFSGRTLYVDDLVTDAAARSQGFGDALFDWLVAHARARGCTEFSLDSGTQRVDAHRFYLRKRMKIASFHFSLPLAK